MSPFRATSFENTVEQVAYLTIALDHWNELARELLPNVGTPAVYEKWTLVLVVKRAVERAAVRALRAEKLPLEMYELTDHADMGRHIGKLPEALDLVTGDYRAVLPEVKNARLLEAVFLDATRKAIQYEIEKTTRRPR